MSRAAIAMIGRAMVSPIEAPMISIARFHAGMSRVRSCERVPTLRCSSQRIARSTTATSGLRSRLMGMADVRSGAPAENVD